MWQLCVNADEYFLVSLLFETSIPTPFFKFKIFNYSCTFTFYCLIKYICNVRHHASPTPHYKNVIIQLGSLHDSSIIEYINLDAF